MGLKLKSRCFPIFFSDNLDENRPQVSLPQCIQGGPRVTRMLVDDPHELVHYIPTIHYRIHLVKQVYRLGTHLAQPFIEWAEFPMTSTRPQGGDAQLLRCSMRDAKPCFHSECPPGNSWRIACFASSQSSPRSL